jgi:hypothetical protein
MLTTMKKWLSKGNWVLAIYFPVFVFVFLLASMRDNLIGVVSGIWLTH